MRSLFCFFVFMACMLDTAAAQSGAAEQATDADQPAAEAELSRAERREQRRREREAEEAANERLAAEREEDGVVCRKEAVTGSHRRIEVCSTAAEREAMRNSARDVITDVTRSRGNLGPEGQ